MSPNDYIKLETFIYGFYEMYTKIQLPENKK